VVCNRFIKFGELLHHARKLGYDYLATGHYAKIVGNTQNVIRNTSLVSPITYHLLSARDKQKDQSYFLYNLTQKQLARVIFPVGNYLKKEVVAMAKKWKLPVAERPESQEICFFPETDYRPFLKRQIKGKIVPGEVVDTKGKVIGKHQGIPLYTIGQRHGFTITDKKVIGPLYVIDKDVKKNRLIVGFGREAERKEFFVKNVNWIDKSAIKLLSNQAIKCKVKIRHQGELLKARIKGDKRNIRNKRVRVVLDEGERGIAPGQVTVFYQKEEVLGGGIIAIDPAKSRFR
jgi:tRNA-specific 2-thiouridylase